MHCYKPIIPLNNSSVQIRVCQGNPRILKSLFENQRRENLFLISLLCSSRAEVSGMDTRAQRGLTRISVLPGAGFGPWCGALLFAGLGGRRTAPSHGCEGSAAPWGASSRRHQEMKWHLVSKSAWAHPAQGQVLHQSKRQFL